MSHILLDFPNTCSLNYALNTYWFFFLSKIERAKTHRVATCHRTMTGQNIQHERKKRFKSKYLLTYTNFLILSSRIIEVLIEYIKHLRSLSSVKKQQQTLNLSLYEAHNMVVVNNKRKKPEIFGGGCKNSDSSGEDQKPGNSFFFLSLTTMQDSHFFSLGW